MSKSKYIAGISLLTLLTGVSIVGIGAKKISDNYNEQIGHYLSLDSKKLELYWEFTDQDLSYRDLVANPDFLLKKGRTLEENINSLDVQMAPFEKSYADEIQEGNKGAIQVLGGGFISLFSAYFLILNGVYLLQDRKNKKKSKKI